MRHFEVGSFLPASRMPQFADVREDRDGGALPGAHSAALALNERGADRRRGPALDEIVCVVSATEEHSQANARRSRADAIELVRESPTSPEASPRRPLVNVGISMAFGCSIAGAVKPDEVLRLVEPASRRVRILSALPTPSGSPGRSRSANSACRRRSALGDRPFIVHLHDTRGLAIANASAALDAGARVLDGSLGGLGGCPFAPGATGNVVFEDLVFLCETKGFRTGIDLDALVGVREILQSTMPAEMLHGALAKAGPPRNLDWRR